MNAQVNIRTTLALLALALLGTPCFGADVWVSTSGADGNDGLSAGTPKATLAAAITLWNGQAAGSDLHVIGGGLFTESGPFDITISGTAGDSARLFGDGALPTLRSVRLNIIGASVEVSNLIFESTGVANGPFTIQNTGVGLTLSNVQVYGDPHCLNIDDNLGSGNQIDGLTIRDSWLQAANNGDVLNFLAGVRVTNLLLERVGVLRLGTAGGGNEIAVTDSTLAHENLTLRNCYVVVAETANPNAGAVVFSGSPVKNIRLENTVIFTSNNRALLITGGSLDGMIVRDCTMTSWWHTIHLYVGGRRNVTIENCDLFLTGSRASYRNACLTFEQQWYKETWARYGDGSRDYVNVTVRNVRCNGGSNGILLQGENGGSRYTYTNVLFENIQVSGQTLHAIAVHGCHVDDVTFRNILALPGFTNDMVTLETTDGEGLWFDGVIGNGASQGAGYEAFWCPATSPAPNPLTGLVIQNCNLLNHPRNGIRIVSGIDNVTIRDNIITGGCLTDPAIRLQAQAGVMHTGGVISGNTINGVAAGGIRVEAPWSDVAIAGNTLTAIRGNGIEAFDGSTTDVLRNVTVSGNTINNVSGTAAIKVQGGQIEVFQNKLTNASTGIHVSPGSGPLSNPEIAHGTAVKVHRNAILAGTGTNAGLVMEAPLGVNFGIGNQLVNNTIHGFPIGMKLVKQGNTASVYNNVLSGNGVGIQLEAGTGSGPSFTFNGYAANSVNNTGFTAVGHKDAFYNILDAAAGYVSMDVTSAEFLKLLPGSPFIDMGSLDGVSPDPTPDADDDIDMGWIESGASEVSAWRLW
ncbi:right-handed parallel beta-helix repeat-containing protein [bacterium]|nr:right-handed parallel beta-helix repeat-containing protein [bacterium]